MTKTSNPIYRIRSAYFACVSLCDNSRDASQWLQQAFDAALAGEKGHRRVEGSAYKGSLADAARYFVVKWFLSANAAPASFAEACALREDALRAYGARDLVRQNEGKDLKWRDLEEEYADVLGFDYSNLFVKAA